MEGLTHTKQFLNLLCIVKNLRFRYASTTTKALLLRSCRFTATICVILTKISNRSGIAVQWNGGGGGGGVVSYIWIEFSQVEG